MNYRLCLWVLLVLGASTQAACELVVDFDEDALVEERTVPPVPVLDGSRPSTGDGGLRSDAALVRPPEDEQDDGEGAQDADAQAPEPSEMAPRTDSGLLDAGRSSQASDAGAARDASAPDAALSGGARGLDAGR